MKSFFLIWASTFGLLFAGNPTLLPAQTKRAHPFRYDGDKNGAFQFSLVYFRGADYHSKLEPQNSKIDMAGMESGVLRFIFYTNGLNFEKNGHRNDYTLVVRPSCSGGTTQELKPISYNDVNIKYKKDGREEFLDYRIVGNGPGELAIGFDVIEKDAPTRCSQTINFNYNVIGMPDPSERLCKQVLDNFKSNKLGTISQLNNLRTKHPNAPCREEVDKILAQYALWKKADETYKADCGKAREICARYNSIYPDGDFKAEIDLIARCTPTPPPPPSAPIVKTRPNQISPDEKEYSLIKTGDTTALRAFIDKYPTSRFVQSAKERLAAFFPIQYEKKELDGGRFQYRLLNADQPRLKDMSLRSGLTIETDRLLSDNIFTVEPSGSGEYEILVKDAKGKQVSIKITNEFYAELTPLPGGDSWLLRVGGGKMPYTVYLTDIANPNDKKTWKGALNADTLTITQADMKKRGYDQPYQVLVKSSDSPAKLVEAGSVEGPRADAGAALLDTIMFLLLLFVMACAGYGLYLLLAQKRARSRKATIYESIR